MGTWKDITSYQRDGDRIPHWWQLVIGDMRIAVGNTHIYYPRGDTWLMHCAPFFETHELKAKSESDAKREAISIVSAKLEKVNSAIREVSSE